MSNSASIMGRHFRYRLWIAEMNADINIMRIFDDYIAEISSKKNEPAVKEGIKNFRHEFVRLRGEIDQLRHEMHLTKMTLAARAREGRESKKTAASPKENHADLKKRYTGYRKEFNKVKKEFAAFEVDCLQ
jgi:hypothetical protein